MRTFSCLLSILFLSMPTLGWSQDEPEKPAHLINEIGASTFQIRVGPSEELILLGTTGARIFIQTRKDGSFSSPKMIDSSEALGGSVRDLDFVVGSKDKLHAFVEILQSEKQVVFYRQYSASGDPLIEWMNLTEANKLDSHRGLPALFPAPRGAVETIGRGNVGTARGLYVGKVNEKGFDLDYSTQPKVRMARDALMYGRVVGQRRKSAQLLFVSEKRFFWTKCNRFQARPGGTPMEGVDIVTVATAPIYANRKGEVYLVAPIQANQQVGQQADQNGNGEPFNLWIASGKIGKRLEERTKIPSAVDDVKTFALAENVLGNVYLFGRISESKSRGGGGEESSSSERADPMAGQLFYWRLAGRDEPTAKATEIVPEFHRVLRAVFVDKYDVILVWGGPDGIYSRPFTMKAGKSDKKKSKKKRKRKPKK